MFLFKNPSMPATLMMHMITEGYDESKPMYVIVF